MKAKKRDDKKGTLAGLPGFGVRPVVKLTSANIQKKGVIGIPEIWPPVKGTRFEVYVPTDTPKVLWTCYSLSHVKKVTEMKRGGYILTDVDGGKARVKEIPLKP